jgi:hypothetical protein
VITGATAFAFKTRLPFLVGATGASRTAIISLTSMLSFDTTEPLTDIFYDFPSPGFSLSFFYSPTRSPPKAIYSEYSEYSEYSDTAIYGKKVRVGGEKNETEKCRKEKA